ncbi:MAG: TonB-dependent receptor [Thermoanaerobaculia bacterium]
MMVLRNAGRLIGVVLLTFFSSGALCSDDAEPPAAAPTPTPTPTLPPVRRSESVTVSAIRAEEAAPVVRTDLSRAAIGERNTGQEMPALLADQPSMSVYAESGGPNGYSYFSIRGVQMTRLNLTYDGAPLNDPEDSTFYFANFGDFAGALGSLQIQRGVGTSTWGAASYGGSVSFESAEPAEASGVSARLAAGSFGTERASVGVESGRFGDGLKFWVRAALQDTNGYRDNSGVTQGAVYWGLARETAGSTFRLSGFYGHEKTQLAFLASDVPSLEANPRDNPMTPEEKDSFWQSLVQAQYTEVLSGRSSLSVQGYFGNAGGWYRVWQDQTAGQLFQYGLDWWRAGGALTYRYEGPRFSLTAGAHGSGFESTHTGGLTDGPEEYSNRGTKEEANGFVKLGWNDAGWHLLADAQVRWARFGYSGDVGNTAKSWTFFNPKVGVRRDLTQGLSAFVSVGQTSREPGRNDLLLGEDNASVLPDLSAVKPERLTDFEVGVDYVQGDLSLHAVLYDMEFHDEIALTGALAPTGLPLRTNVARSTRRGVELDGRWKPVKELLLGATLNASRNRIREWTQYYDVYDAAGNYTGSTSRTFSDVAPLLTPELIASIRAEWSVLPWVVLSANARYAGTSFLDNTDDPSLATPHLFTLGAGLAFDLTGVMPGKPRLRVVADNLTNDTKLWPSGYSYLFATEDGHGGFVYSGTPYYYPLASRSVIVMLEVGF